MSNSMQSMSQFEGIRKHIDEQGEIWYCIVDVVEILAETPHPGAYWPQLKKRAFGELLPFWQKFSIPHRTNGRRYQMDCANQEGILRIIQVIPSPKADPFRHWLAMTGSRRLDEIKRDPMEAKRDQLRMMGFNEKEVEHRLSLLGMSNDLKEEWGDRGIEPADTEILTDEIHKGTFEGMTRRDHANLKELDEGDMLDDHMTPLEVAFTILGQSGTLTAIQESDPQGFQENAEIAKDEGEKTGRFRRVYEDQTGRKVISDKSYIEEVKKLDNGSEDVNSEDEQGK